jgi:hypothetical protein
MFQQDDPSCSWTARTAAVSQVAHKSRSRIWLHQVESHLAVEINWGISSVNIQATTKNRTIIFGKVS